MVGLSFYSLSLYCQTVVCYPYWGCHCVNNTTIGVDSISSSVSRVFFTYLGFFCYRVPFR